MTNTLERLDAALERADRALASGRKWPLLLFLSAFLIKLIYVLQSSDALFIQVPIMDSRIYDATAQQISAGNLLGKQAFFMGPLYPYLLSLVYSIFGRDFTVVRIMQIIGGSATVVLTFVLGRMLFRPSVAFAAGIMLCLYGAVTFYDGLLLMSSLGTLLNIAALTMLVRVAKKPSNVGFAIAGALVGISALARANILVFVPVVIVWIIWILRTNRRWLHAGVFAGATVVMLLPAAIHNYVVSEEFVLVTSNAGFNFYLGNNANANGFFTNSPEIDFVHDPTTGLYVKRLTGKVHSPSELSRYWFTRAFSEMNDDPGRAASLMFKKFALFWNGYEAPQIDSFDSVRKRYGILRLLFVNFWWLTGLGVIGMFLHAGRARERWLLYGFVGAYALSIILFFITARYRVQIVPVMALFAAHALVGFVTHGLRSPRRAGAFLVGLAVTMLLTQPGLFAADKAVIEYRERIHEARRLSDIGQYKPALSAIDRAIDASPDIAEGYVHRAIIHKVANNELKAIEDYARALNVNPSLAAVHYDLAQSLRRMNFHEEAIVEYELAIKVEPMMIQARNNLGITYRDLRMFDEAAQAFRGAIELDPKYVKAYNNLGACLAEADRIDEAISVFEEATRSVPEYANSYKNLAMAYVTLKRPQPAIEWMEQYLVLVPDDNGARSILNQLHEAVAADTTTIDGANN